MNIFTCVDRSTDKKYYFSNLYWMGRGVGWEGQKKFFFSLKKKEGGILTGQCIAKGHLF